ncbi:MAG: glycoside hydrolase family 25 protein [Nocardioidaceae bacterium]
MFAQTLAAARRTRRSVVVVGTAVAALAASTLAYADGVDVSHWQGTIAWSKVDNAGIQFAFMKATEGATYTDPMLARNWAATQQVGIYRGAYHFARPSVGSAGTQARYFVSKVGSFKKPGVLPPVLDLEVTGGLGPASLRTWVSNWLTTVENLTGRRPILYFSPSFWETRLGNSTAFTRYPLWIAHYTTASAPRVPGGWSTWTFWQRTNSGRVSGIPGDVDMNRFNGTTAQLARLAWTTGGTTAPAQPGPTVPAAAATTLSMTASKTTATVGERVSFAGYLRTASAPTGIAGRTVSLWSKSAASSTWGKVASGTTNSAGHYSLSAPMSTASDYQARFVGGSAYASSTASSIRVTAVRAVATTDLHKEKDRVPRGAPLMIYGHVTTPAGGVAGSSVSYYKRPVSGGAWILVRRSTSLAPTGWHSITIRPRRAMVWKAVSRGGPGYTGDTSNYVTVRVY